MVNKLTTLTYMSYASRDVCFRRKPYGASSRVEKTPEADHLGNTTFFFHDLTCRPPWRIPSVRPTERSEQTKEESHLLTWKRTQLDDWSPNCPRRGGNISHTSCGVSSGKNRWYTADTPLQRRKTIISNDDHGARKDRGRRLQPLMTLLQGMQVFLTPALPKILLESLD